MSDTKAPPARIQRMLAKSAGIRSTADIPQSEAPALAEPQTPVGMRGALAAAQARIKELESQGGLGTALPLSSIVPNPRQPRRRFDDASLDSLAANIKAQGLMQPVLVRRVPGVDDKYMLVVGERRFRAHQRLGESSIKAVVVELNEADQALWALSENINREDLSAYEVARSLRELEPYYSTRTDMADKLGMSRSQFYRYLKFEKLPEFTRVDLETQAVNLGSHAAEAIANVLEQHGDSAAKVLQELWPKVRGGEIDQLKIASRIEAVLSRSVHQTTPKTDVKHLYLRGQKAGQIVKDGRNFTIKIKSTLLDEKGEAELRQVVERYFNH